LQLPVVLSGKSRVLAQPTRLTAGRGSSNPVLWLAPPSQPTIPR
jgi:hypothetical protein